MAIFKEVVRGDGSGIAEYYRVQDGKVVNVDYSMVTNKPTLNGVILSGDLTMEDFGMDIEGAVETLTGEEISRLKKEDNKIVLCTTDYLYTDSEGLPIQTERGSVYEIYNGIIVDKISTGGSGGGGSSNPRSNFSEPVSDLEQNVSVNADNVILEYKFVTTARPNTGTAKLYVNNVLKSTKAVESGKTYSFNVSEYLQPGINYFSIKTTDSYDTEKTLDFIVNGMQLTISSTFDVSTVLTQPFDFRYRVSGIGDKKVHFVLDEEDTVFETNSNGVDLTKNIDGLSHGAHTLEVYAIVELDDGVLQSNTLKYDFLVVEPNEDTPLILSTFNQTECMEGDLLSIDYLVYNPETLTSDVQFLINDEPILNVKADRLRHVWGVSNYPIGTVTFSIVANGIRVDKVVEVSKLDIAIQEATEGLELYLTAKNRSNNELEDTREVWSYNDIEAELSGFNWVTNGWINNKLKLSGPAQVTIPFHPFDKDIRKNGKTIEITFTTHDVFNLESVLVKCMDGTKGFEIKTNSSYLGSEQTGVTTNFADGITIRLSFVIESSGVNRLIKTYINGVLSGLRQYSTTDNFQHTNISDIIINPDGEEVDIECIRIYDRALSSVEVVNNYIFDLASNEEKMAKFKENNVYDAYNNISYPKLKARMPIVTVTGEMPGSKGDKKTVSVQFENAQNDKLNFQFEGCTIDVQGTSSQYYPRKNWKIKLPEAVQAWVGGIAEDTYTLKADFMESSHTNNVGTAQLANTLYNENFPTKTAENGVRDAIYGFPCAMFLKDTETSQPVFYGTYMFNNDKGNADTLGLTTDKSESWEFKNNTSDLCLFKTADFTAADVSDNLEARYPDKYTDYTALSRVFSWVVSCKDNPTKFKEEFAQYFNLEYCLVYQVLMEMAMLVDSRAKNMFLDTTDGLIWYPRFYDMDTAWGLNNEGELKWNYDVEIHDRIGDAYVWDERGESVFWNLFEEAYADEIIDKYHELRKNKLTYENIIQYYITDISSKFGASEYNEDAQFKYINPLADENNSTYLYAAQGNRQDYFRWLVENRLHYLDSKYEYGDFNSDYATMRLYTQQGSLTLSTYLTEYVAVKYGSSIVKKKLEANNPTEIPAPNGLVFNDTEVIVYGASQVTDFGNLANKYPGTIDISKCQKLQRLIVGSKETTNTNLISLSLGNNPLLREIDVTNCPNLSGELDVSTCSDIRIVKAQGTSISSVGIKDGSNIEELYLPNTITTLRLVDLKALKTLEADSFSNVSTLIYSNCGVDIQEILCLCPGLTRLRIHFDEKSNQTMDMSQFMYYHNNMLGVDDLGYNTEHPILTGKVHIVIQNYITNSEIEEYKQTIADNYPNLEVTYETIPSQLTFKGYYVSPTGANYNYTPNVDIPYFFDQSNAKKPGFQGSTNEANIEFYFVSANTNNKPKGNLFLPTTYKGKPIVAIGTPSSSTGAFASCTELLSITVPTSYRVLDSEYFIEQYSCVGGYASDTNYSSTVNGKKTYSLDTPDAYLTFNGCTKLVSVNWKITGSKPKIGYKMFQNCKALKHIGDCNKVKCLCLSALYGVTTTTDYESPKSFDFSGIDCWAGYQNNVSECGINFKYNDIKIDFSKIKYIYGGYGVFSGYHGPLDFASLITCERRPYYLFYNSCFTGTVNLNNKFLYPPFDRCIITGQLTGVDNVTTLGSPHGDNYNSCSFSVLDTTRENPLVFPNATKVINLKLAASGMTFGETQYPSSVTEYVSLPKLDTITVASTRYSESKLDGAVHIIDIPESPKIKLINSGTSGLYSSDFGDDTIEFQPYIDGFDCSQNAMGIYLYYSFKKLKSSFGGFINQGQSYSESKGTNYSGYNITFSSTTFGKDSIINIFDKLYDLAAAGLPSQTIKLDASDFNLLTSDEIAIATNKGWNVTK